MGKRKNNMLPSINDDVLDAVHNSSRSMPETIFSKKQYGEVLLKKVDLKCKNSNQTYP
jgi:hypothetical protein